LIPSRELTSCQKKTHRKSTASSLPSSMRRMSVNKDRVKHLVKA